MVIRLGLIVALAGYSGEFGPGRDSARLFDAFAEDAGGPGHDLLAQGNNQPGAYSCVYRVAAQTMCLKGTAAAR